MKPRVVLGIIIVVILLILGIITGIIESKKNDIQKAKKGLYSKEEIKIKQEK